MLKLTKRRSVVVLCALVALGLAVGAYAYFTSTGSGTDQTAAIGTSSNFTVSFGTATGTMYPGAGTDSIPYTITNTNTGSQRLNAVTATVNADGSGNITSSGTPVVGCLAAWFTATPATVTPTTLAPNGTFNSTIAVTMTDSGTNQNPCQGKAPDIVVNAS